MTTPTPVPDEDLPYRILLVDDDEVDRMAVRRALRRAEPATELREAEDVERALDILPDGFDCVLLDHRLPGGDGLEVIREARRRGIDTPMVMLTGQEDPRTVVELMKAGAADYLLKADLTPEGLGRSVHNAVRLHRAESQTRRAEAERERAVASRGRFFAAMSHELRTPINAIMGYNELILDGIYGPLESRQRGGLERSQRAARHLLELVNDVLDLSKLEAGKLDLAPEEVRVPDLIQDLFATVRPLADERGSALQLIFDDCVEPIVTDPRRLRQILLNLFSNAFKFGAGNPVNVRCVEQEEDGVVVEVEDRGVGIAADDHERIFEEFVQLSDQERAGTGLGLPISRALAELLGGKLELDSRPGEGSVFRLHLPRRIPDTGGTG